MASKLEDAELQLKAWHEASLAVSRGQSYTIGNQTLTRASSAEIRKNIALWEAKIKALKGGSVRFYQGLPL